MRLTDPTTQTLERSNASTCVVRPQDFNFECPVAFFKADSEPEGKQRRIAGIISTENRDQQNETILQRGLDFNPFIRGGWFNDNHLKGTTDILGYPEKVEQYPKGARLPDGSIAKHNLTWSEGYLLDTKKANDVWELGQALAKTGRRLGFSVEGHIESRHGINKSTIAKATIRNVAITHCPVNEDTRLETLARSLAAVEAANVDTVSKAAGAGMGVATPDVPETGMTSGNVTTRESLESDLHYNGKAPTRKRKRKASKSLTDAEACQWLKARMPGLDHDSAFLFVRLTKALRRRGLLSSPKGKTP